MVFIIFRQQWTAWILKHSTRKKKANQNPAGCFIEILREYRFHSSDRRQHKVLTAWFMVESCDSLWQHQENTTHSSFTELLVWLSQDADQNNYCGNEQLNYCFISFWAKISGSLDQKDSTFL